MPIRFPLDPDPRRTISEARAAADDLERMLAGAWPTAADLARAPVIDLWRPALRPAFALIGVVHGHPTVAAGHTALTSDIVAFDLDGLSWARSRSRLYALGGPLDCAGGMRQ